MALIVCKTRRVLPSRLSALWLVFLRQSYYKVRLLWIEFGFLLNVVFMWHFFLIARTMTVETSKGTAYDYFRDFSFVDACARRKSKFFGNLRPALGKETKRIQTVPPPIATCLCFTKSPKLRRPFEKCSKPADCNKS